MARRETLHAVYPPYAPPLASPWPPQHAPAKDRPLLRPAAANDSDTAHPAPPRPRYGDRGWGFAQLNLQH
ncbi:hypothetical protein PG993_014039 [Apiospora rasikravindrae]|uniref:Uncharacterized protein n=1 Tax=Apiospora rasikravindrae TaxID=990691 RepID=A0ABR1RRX6_9PEZI